MIILFLFSSLLTPGSVAFPSSEDGFIRGYAAAVLEREYGVSPASLHVRNCVIMLNADAVKPDDLPGIISILMGIRGVVRVEISGPEPLNAESIADSVPPVNVASEVKEQTVSDRNEDTLHPKQDRLFEPLMADPRWPRFAVSYHFFTDNGEIDNLIASAIGGTIPVYESTHPFTGAWQVAIQAAAFAINDLDTSSWDLLNSDYRFGLALLNRKGPVSGIFRVYHFSTHAGDEFILNSGATREELSYEAVDAIVSRTPREWLRVYGGGAYRFSRHPKELDPWSLQYGLELKSPHLYLKVLRPVAGANFYNKGENDWHTEVSLRMGAEIENRETGWHKIQFLVGYFNGPSPYGQFFYQSHEYLDFGVHLYY